MKKTLILFLSTLTLLSCSSDDEVNGSCSEITEILTSGIWVPENDDSVLAILRLESNGEYFTKSFLTDNEWSNEFNSQWKLDKDCSVLVLYNSIREFRIEIIEISENSLKTEFGNYIKHSK